MKKSILLLFVFILSLAFTASAQDPEKLRKMKELQERGEKITAAFDAIANASPSLKALKDRGERDEMIVEAAKTGDSTLIPPLKVLASDKGPSGGVLTSDKRLPRSIKGGSAFLAHVALAKLGDPDVLPEIFAELETTDIVAQDSAIAKLAQIGTKEAYRKLYELLDDKTIRPHAADELIGTKSERVMGELHFIFSDSPRRPSGAVNYDTAAWKAWFANKHLIE